MKPIKVQTVVPKKEEIIQMYEDKLATQQKQYEDLANRFNTMSKSHAELSNAYNQLINSFKELKAAFKIAMKYYD